MWLGICYQKGLGVKQNDAEALKYLTFAADNNLAEAQYYLGRMYCDGAGVSKDPEGGLIFLRRAAANARFTRKVWA